MTGKKTSTRNLAGDGDPYDVLEEVVLPVNVTAARKSHLSRKEERVRRYSDQAYPADTTTILISLIREFQVTRSPIQVSFRELVPWLRVGERATHYLHTYPAKLLPQICHFFLAAKGWLPSDANVLDPFCGTGTVPLEAILSGRQALFADANPLAALITRAKTTAFDLQKAEDTVHVVASTFKAIESAPIPWVVNIDYWYTNRIKEELSRIRAAIYVAVPDDLSDLFWATFSATARKCSLANPRFAVPVLDRNARLAMEQRSAWNVFSNQFKANIKRYRAYQAWCSKSPNIVFVGDDARKLILLKSEAEVEKCELPPASVDCILTSPPYAGAQKYIRASSLNLGWLGATGPRTLKELENASIGREHLTQVDMMKVESVGIPSADNLINKIRAIDPLRAAICGTYLVEMRSAIAEVCRVLKRGGVIIMIIGDNTVCGLPFSSSQFLETMLLEFGLDLQLKLVDDIKQRGLLMKRQGGAAAIKSESILVFQKVTV